jgi:hypothetical protein
MVNINSIDYVQETIRDRERIYKWFLLDILKKISI